MTFDLASYLDRIGVTGPLPADLASLATIQWAHLQSVTFENLDIRPLMKAIKLDRPSLQDKIVRRRRGGFCYELNGLLSEALRTIGYEVTIVSVQFVHDDGLLSPPFDHMALLVEPPGSFVRYLVDVGAGNGSPARPLPLIDGHTEVQPETGLGYRLTRRDDSWQVNLRVPDAEWRPEYRFTIIPRQVEDFLDRCRYQDGAPDSHFTQGPLCSKNTPGGRITIGGGRLIVTKQGERTETELLDDESLYDALWTHFGITLDGEKH
jgi:N-hydroxyarylamine O-acetyltransferase